MAEGFHEGTHGPVGAVLRHEDASYTLQVTDETSPNLRQILVNSSQVVIEDPKWAVMVKEKRVCPLKIDWRKLNTETRENIAKSLAITNCEKITHGVTLELGTVAAMLHEITQRIPIDEQTMLVEPSISRIMAAYGIEELPTLEPRS